MASKKVEIHEEAALEYEAALEWYLEPSLLAASKFVDALSHGMDMIVDAPHRWPNFVLLIGTFRARSLPALVETASSEELLVDEEPLA